ncbi:hypothetical protein F5X98DRAFT_377944 [Xylaria grammica]|nr:hypothetical protein F5X98DRAFT_377944 [Xylaria grammica]
MPEDIHRHQPLSWFARSRRVNGQRLSSTLYPNSSYSRRPARRHEYHADSGYQDPPPPYSSNDDRQHASGSSHSNEKDGHTRYSGSGQPLIITQRINPNHIPFDGEEHYASPVRTGENWHVTESNRTAGDWGSTNQGNFHGQGQPPGISGRRNDGAQTVQVHNASMSSGDHQSEPRSPGVSLAPRNLYVGLTGGDASSIRGIGGAIYPIQHEW